MRSIICVFLLSFSLNFATGQQIKLRFNSTTSVGLAAGENTNSMIFETINGIKFSDWFAGVGVGVDWYRYKTLPLFANGKRYFGADKEAFGYGSIGYNFPLKNKPGREMGYYDDYHFSGGIYMDAGIGYAFPLGRQSSLVFSAGFSYKEVQAMTIIHICPFIPPCYDDAYNYKFNYGRIVLKAGVGF